MHKLQNARTSPRIVDGVIKFYEKDTFVLNVDIRLENECGEPIDIDEDDDTIQVVFFDKSGNKVLELTYTDVVNNTISIEFDSTVTALFPQGRYTYNVFHTSADKRTTLVDSNTLVVE